MKQQPSMVPMELRLSLYPGYRTYKSSSVPRKAPDLIIGSARPQRQIHYFKTKQDLRFLEFVRVPKPILLGVFGKR